MTYAYSALILLDLGLIRWGDDGSWVIVILLFLPRWLFLIPLIALGVASGGRAAIIRDRPGSDRPNHCRSTHGTFGPGRENLEWATLGRHISAS